MIPAEADRGGDSQLADGYLGVGLDGGMGIVDVGEYFLTALIVEAPPVSFRYSAGGPCDQPDSQLTLQIRKNSADRGQRQLQCSGRRRQAACLKNRHQNTHRF